MSVNNIETAFDLQDDPAKRRVLENNALSSSFYYTREKQASDVLNCLQSVLNSHKYNFAWAKDRVEWKYCLIVYNKGL